MGTSGLQEFRRQSSFHSESSALLSAQSYERQERATAWWNRSWAALVGCPRRAKARAYPCKGKTKEGWHFVDRIGRRKLPHGGLGEGGFGQVREYVFCVGGSDGGYLFPGALKFAAAPADRQRVIALEEEATVLAFLSAKQVEGVPYAFSTNLRIEGLPRVPVFNVDEEELPWSYVAMQKFYGGDLFDATKAASQARGEEAGIQDGTDALQLIFLHTMGLLETLHSEKLIHRDLKPENLMFATSFSTITFSTLKDRLLRQDLPLRLIDFGGARLYPCSERGGWTIGYTPRIDYPYGVGADLESLAWMYARLSEFFIPGMKPPWSGMRDDHAIRRSQEAWLESGSPEFVLPELVAFIKHARSLDAREFPQDEYETLRNLIVSPDPAWYDQSVMLTQERHRKREQENAEQKRRDDEMQAAYNRAVLQDMGYEV